MTYALEITSLRKTYANEFEALKGIDLAVEEGDFFALLGPNGAGKSTAIGIISSLVNKSSGKIRIFGVDIDENFPKAKTFLGVVPQEVNFNVFESPMRILLNQAGFYGIHRNVAVKRAEIYLRQLGLWEKRDDRSRNLSGGMKRRLMIARALIHEPKLLILDEPTAGVDIEIRRSMWEFLTKINKAGTTIILTTHYLEEAENLCRNIAIIDHGKIVENTSMRALLRQLDTETFVLDLASKVDASLQIPGHAVRIRDEHTIEVDVDRGASVNDVFESLTAKDVQVLSMRNKSNRLEQLFVNLTEPGLDTGATAATPTAGGQ